MKKHIKIGDENFTIIILKTVITEDAYNKTVGDHHTWTVKAMQDDTLLSTDKTRNESNVISLVRAAQDYIERCARKSDADKTLEQKLSEMGFN